MSYCVWPHRWQPTRLPRPWVLQVRTLEWVAISFSNAWKWKVKVKSESEVAQSCPTPSDSMEGSLPGSSLVGFFQASVLEWIVIAFSHYKHKMGKKNTWIYFNRFSFKVVIFAIFWAKKKNLGKRIVHANVCNKS